jgi:hypothetical protein
LGSGFQVLVLQLPTFGRIKVLLGLSATVQCRHKISA